MTILLSFNSVLCIESRKGEGGALLAFTADLIFFFFLLMALNETVTDRRHCQESHLK